MRPKVEIQQKIEEGLIETALLKMETSFLLLRLRRIGQAAGVKIIIKNPPFMVLRHNKWMHDKERGKV